MRIAPHKNLYFKVLQPTEIWDISLLFHAIFTILMVTNNNKNVLVMQERKLLEGHGPVQSIGRKPAEPLWTGNGR